MSADLLRRAAAEMREKAEAAPPGPWVCYGDLLAWPSEKGPAANDPIFGGIGPAHDESADYIASMHPAVALAMADWLDKEAEGIESGNWRPCFDPALTVARAYLGEDA